MSIKIDKSQAIEIFKNDSYDRTWILTDPNDGSAVDLTNVTSLLTIDSLQDPPDDSTQVAQVSGTVGGTSNNELTFTLPALAFPTSGDNIKFFYDIQLTGLTWGPMTLFKSIYTLTMDITK